MRASTIIIKVGRGCLTRSYAMAPARPGILEKLQARKNLFLEANDIPVHIKGGVKDNILAKTTAVMVTTGYFFGLYTAVIAVKKT
ncbi:unnamed protein product [Ceutorhynchus assimilis]|uniref:Cytochrome c oxidase subunit 7A2 n=1 Tax=Ceutorhynchus assimilis TaxID=467358 RepID=A0A9N9QPH2_9CUCU|nr:unnamed protein product [Ceutorhynchus assimilis]